MVLPDSRRVPRVPRYLGWAQEVYPFSRTGLSPSMADRSKSLPLRGRLVTSLPPEWKTRRPATPTRHSEQAGLGCSRFARHYSGNRDFFLFLGLLRWFSSPGSPPESFRDDAALPAPGFPIRISPDHGLLTAPRGLSQCAASFIGSGHQGIHRMPLSACCRHSSWKIDCQGAL